MMLVWSKSTSPLSLLIRAITGDDCSHFAFVFGSRASGVMFESNLLGTHIKFFQSSLKTHQIVHSIAVDVPIEIEDMVWDRVVETYDGKRYDIGGAIYLGLRILAHRLFRLQMPSKNIWADPDAYFCDEVYEALELVPGFPKLNAGNGLETPHDIWLKLKEILK